MYLLPFMNTYDLALGLLHIHKNMNMNIAVG